MSSLGEIAEEAAGVVVSDVLEEAGAELSGRSGRKWALILLSLLVGAALGALLAKKLRNASS